MDIKEIQNLIKFVSKSGVEEVKIEREDFKITIKTKKNLPQQIVVDELPSKINIPPQAIVPVSQEVVQDKPLDLESAKTEDLNHIIVKSPIIGTTPTPKALSEAISKPKFAPKVLIKGATVTAAKKP